MNLILIEPSEVDAEGIASLTGARAHHMQQVLGVVRGDRVRIGIVDGCVGHGTVEAMSPDGVRLHCSLDQAVPDRPLVDLLLALPRPKVLRRLWPQLSALGVGQVMLTNAYRVERNYFDTHLLSPDVYRPLLIEGLQQARDTRVPEVTVHRQLKVFLEDELGDWSDAAKVYADPRSESSIRDGLAGRRSEGRVLLGVGPEGGWTDYERGMLAAQGFRAVAMGARPLRSDTACVALLALVHDALRAPSSSR